MAKLIHATLEPCDQNDAGCSVTLYYEGDPTNDEVANDCDNHCRGRLPLTALTNDEFFEVTREQNALSKYARLTRVQANPCG